MVTSISPAEAIIKTNPIQSQSKLTATGCHPRMPKAGTQKNMQNKPNLSRATTRDLTNHRKSQRVRICPKPHTERTILQERFIKNKANFTTNRDNTTSSSKKDYDEKFRAGGNKNKPNAEGPDLSGDNDPWSIRYHPESRRAGKASRRISARTMGNRTYSVLPFYKKQSQFPQQ